MPQACHCQGGLGLTCPDLLPEWVVGGVFHHMACCEGAVPVSLGWPEDLLKSCACFLSCFCFSRRSRGEILLFVGGIILWQSLKGTGCRQSQMGCEDDIKSQKGYLLSPQLIELCPFWPCRQSLSLSVPSRSQASQHKKPLFQIQ